MRNEFVLNEKWIKASIIGTIWAASEIVLGSFLHNFKFPFSGNLLTSIAIIILISISYVWKEKGLFWRAGLICAIMKTMSPSAVIFGPMIAIISESLLLEMSVRLLGRTIAGYLLGAILAMSWNLIQKIGNFILFYGYNIVALYTDLLKYAQKQLSIHFDIVWLPILFLLIGYVILGAISAIIGIKIGRKIVKQPLEIKTDTNNSESPNRFQAKNIDFNYSLVWLTVNVVLLIGSLVLLNVTSWMIWSTTIAVIVIIWAIRYKRALRQLSKPKFWIFFIVLTMVTAYIFNKMQPQSKSVIDGLLIGFQMNFRAVLIIVGFSVLGTELFNPKIRAFFLKTSFKQLPLALELAFESLPSMIGRIPDFKSIVKNPVSVIYQVVALAEFRLNEIKHNIGFNQKIFILTGKIAQGKTTKIQEIVADFKQKQIAIGGIYSPRVMENNLTIGYDVVDISTSERTLFLRNEEHADLSKIGKYSIFPQGLSKGKNALTFSANVTNQLVIIDEVGKLELDNEGWASSLENLINHSTHHILLVVRDSFIEPVIQKWNLKNPIVFQTSENEHNHLSSTIINQLN